MTDDLSFDDPQCFEPLDPEPRLLMGPGPVDVYPRVLRAMSNSMLGQFDPQFTEYMNQVMVLYRQIYRTHNHWTFLVNGTARAGIEACLTSLITPGDRVLIPIFGRFGHLLAEIASRSGGEVIPLETTWGAVFSADQLREAVLQYQPKMLALVHGDTSTTMAQPLHDIGPICRDVGVLTYVDATATLGGMLVDTDAWCLDAVSSGLQKCMSGPPGTSPVTLSERSAELIKGRRHIEAGIRSTDFKEVEGTVIQSNYLDLAMLMAYWSPMRLNHHTESTSMLYAARECARVVLQEGLEHGFARHSLASRALREGLVAIGLELFGDAEHRMDNVTGVCIPSAIRDEAAIRSSLLNDFGIEIGTSFGPLQGKIWRIGTMGYVCRKANVLRCLSALEYVLDKNGFSVRAGAGVDAACAIYNNE
ncbi:MAG: aminotransferase [Acidiferrobacteraceae bacterium]|nr:aminotransferase [Acidiferrobacteraceae bacterium]